MGRKIRYDPEALRQNIKNCTQNVKLFQKSISKENAIIAEYERKLQKDDREEIQIVRIKRTLKNSKKGIKLFEEAIEKEYESKMDLKILLKEAEKG